MRRLIAAVLVFTLINAALLIAQAPPELINLQGRLTDASGNAITANTDMRFDVYDASSGGNLLLSDEHAGGSAVTVTDGHYNTLLGGGAITTGTESDLGAVFANNSGVYIEIYVHNGSAYEMLSPRVQLVSSAYALNSALSQDSALLEGQPGSHYKQDLADVLSQGGSAGNVGISDLSDPTNPSDAATKNYVDSQASSLSTQVTTNTSNISTNSGNISANSSAITTLQGTVTTNTGNISTNAGNISSNSSSISVLDSSHTSHTGDSSAHHALTLAASATDVSTTESEIDQALDGVSGNVTAANLNILTGGGETALHAHASGSGSSLDADLLDSLNSTQFLRSDTSASFNGAQLTATGELIVFGNTFLGDAGTDLHTITGNVAIGTTSANSPLEVDGDVSLLANKLKFGGSGVEDTVLYRSAANLLRTDDNFKLAGDQQRLIQIDSFTNSSAGSIIQIRKGRGTEGVPSGVGLGDTIGYLNFMGYDGTTFRNGSQIMVQVDKTPGPSDFPTNMMFRTVPDGSIIPAEAMRITSSQNVGIGSNNPTQKLDVSGTVKATAFVGDGSGLTGVAAGTATDTDTLDSLDSTDFLRATASSTLTSGNTLTVAGVLDVTGTFALGGTTVTANATELSLLAGKTGVVWTSTNDGNGSLLDADQLDGLHSNAFIQTTGGTMTGSLNLTGGLSIGGTAVTSTAAELNKLDGVSANVTAANLSTLVGAGNADSLHGHDVTGGWTDGGGLTTYANTFNVGIGETNATTRLHITGTTTDISFDNTAAGQETALSVNGSGQFVIWDRTANKGLLFMEPTGETVIGGVTPQAKLHVYDNLAGNSFLVNNTSTGDLAIFQKSGLAKVVINNAGNLGIGSSTPGTTLDLVGTARITNATSGNGLGITQTGTGVALNIDHQSTGSNAQVISSSATRTPGYFLLHVTDQGVSNNAATLRASNAGGSGSAIWAYKNAGTGEALRISQNGTGPGIGFDSGAATLDSADGNFDFSGDTLRNIGGLGIGIATPNSTAHINGSTSVRINNITGTAAAGDATVIFLDGSAAAATANLPDATTVTGRIYWVRAINTTNACTIAANGGQTIDGSATLAVSVDQTFLIISDGSNWHTLSQHTSGF